MWISDRSCLYHESFDGNILIILKWIKLILTDGNIYFVYHDDVRIVIQKNSFDFYALP